MEKVHAFGKVVSLQGFRFFSLLLVVLHVFQNQWYVLHEIEKVQAFGKVGLFFCKANLHVIYT